jgi:ribonuclease Z
MVWVDTGQRVQRLLFDCGEECQRELPVAEIQAIDALFFSHLHVDHVAGFDTFLRHNYNRDGGPVQIFGPPGTATTLQHRFRGFSRRARGQAGGGKPSSVHRRVASV